LEDKSVFASSNNRTKLQVNIFCDLFRKQYQILNIFFIQAFQFFPSILFNLNK
jgi:hypothetical protein